MILSYCDRLKKQYQMARGICTFDNSKEANYEFIEWLKERQKIKEYYQHYLLTAGFYYDEITSVELGKGKYDTITSSDTRATLVTEYASSFQREIVPEKIFLGAVRTIGDGPCVVIENRQKRVHTMVFLNNANLFYTQNPYSTKVLDTLAQIHNSGRTIVVGAYGKLNDKDRLAKIEELKQFKNQLIHEKYKEVYSYIKDSYVYFLYTDKTNFNKQHRKVYTLS